MEEDTNKVETPAQPSVHTVIRRINLPQHQLQAAIRQAVARNQVTEEEGQDILWLYSYCNENHLDERDVAPLVGFEKNTIYQVFRGMYQAASWRNVITGIRKFKTVMTNEMKRRDIGFILTSIADKIFKACDSALNDNMPAIIVGPSQIGKTFALEQYQRDHNHGRTVMIRLGSKWTKARFVRELAAKFNNGVKATRCWALEDAIFGSLTRYNLLIIDETQMALETSGKNGAKDIIEFIREIHDRTGCGLVMSFTSQGIKGFDADATYEQMKFRGCVRLQLPEVPPVKDINAFARAFDLPVPEGNYLNAIKILIRRNALGVFVKYLQKAHKTAKERKQNLTWDVFAAVNDGYQLLAAPKKSDY